MRPNTRGRDSPASAGRAKGTWLLVQRVWGADSRGTQCVCANQGFHCSLGGSNDKYEPSKTTTKKNGLVQNQERSMSRLYCHLAYLTSLQNTLIAQLVNNLPAMQETPV